MCILFPVSFLITPFLLNIFGLKRRTFFYPMHVLVSCYSLWPLSEVLMELGSVWRREVYIRGLEMGVDYSLV